jgi:hypothetical protein
VAFAPGPEVIGLAANPPQGASQYIECAILNAHEAECRDINVDRGEVKRSCRVVLQMLCHALLRGMS